jgi:hypothetical protein
MTGTEQSASPAQPRPRAGLPRTHLRSLLAAPLALAAVAWPFGELMHAFPWPMLGGGVGVTLSSVWRARRDRERWPEQRAVDRALREHVDPGPEHRPAVDQAARVQLARPAGTWVAGIVIVGLLVAACVRTALVRGEAMVALSAVPAMAAFVWGVVHQRRHDARADRWLAEPPAPAEEAA